MESIIKPFVSEIQRYRVHIRAINSIEMPEYAGSALRGAFGHALKDSACLSAAQNKGKCVCRVEDACVYQQLFAPLAQQSQALSRHYTVAPPLIIEAHAMPSKLEPEQHAYFDVTCIGQQANAQWPIIQLALQKALKKGIGWRHPERGSAQLLAVNTLTVPEMEAQSTDDWHIQLLSHTRLQHQGHILKAQEWEASHWFMALMRRYTLMQEAYQLPLPQVNWQKLAPLISQLSWHSVDLHDVEWTRWSNRQKQTVPLNGVIGTFVLESVPPALQPYVYYGQWLHVGKNSMFGLGQYQVLS